MPEETEILVGIKIWASDHTWVEDEQRRIRDTEGKKPTQAGLFRRMRAAFGAASSSSRSGPGSNYLERNKTLHDKLEQILNSGDEGIIAAVVPNIDIFFDRLKPSAKRRAGGK